MYQYNRDEVEKLIEGLRNDGEDVTLENLDKFLQSAGVLVRVHVGRVRGNMELTPEFLGIDANSSNLLDFFSDYTKNGSLTFIPLSYEKELKKVESRVRMAQSRMSIAYDNSYMPITVYEFFKKKLKEAQKDYDEIRDRILADWHNILTRFEFTLNQALSALNPKDREPLKQAIMNRIPKKSVYRESFYMRTSLKAFPVMENVLLPDAELAEEVKKGALEDNIRMVHEVLGGALNEAFDVVNTVYASFEKNQRVAPKTHGALKEAVKRVRQRDMFKNAMITSITDDMETLSIHLRSNDVPEMCENLLSKIYGYAMEIKVGRYINLKDTMMEPEDMEITYQTMSL